MAGLTGLTGIAGYQVQIKADSQASPEDRMGNPVNPGHAGGETSGPYAYNSAAGQTGSAGPYGPNNQLLGNELDFWESGGEAWQDPTFDHTPNSHAAPWPTGISSGPVPNAGPDAIANQLVQSRWAHSVRTGAGLKSLTGMPALNDDWQSYEQVNPGNSDLRPLDRQALSSGFMWGTRDRTQSMAVQNGYGFDSAHTHRRWATGGIPGNTMWMKPGGRPMVKSLPGPARPAIGPSSPFADQDLGQAFGINGAMLQNIPTEYVPPPQPNIATATQHDNSSVVEWY